MRVTSGFARSMPIRVPRSQSTRPTSEKVRSAILNSLQPIINNETRVLDLYAGTGALGLEALSRGAGRLIAVEKDRECQKILEANLTEIERRAVAQNLSPPRWEVWGLDAQVAYERLAKNKSRFEVVFADPPYAILMDSFESIVKWSSELLEDGGILCMEMASRDLDLIRERSYTDLNLVFARHRAYGKTAVIVLEKLTTVA